MRGGKKDSKVHNTIDLSVLDVSTLVGSRQCLQSFWLVLENTRVFATEFSADHHLFGSDRPLQNCSDI